MSNVNDGLIPYEGELPWWAAFLAATDAIYRVAQSQGFTGDPLSGPQPQVLMNKFGNTSISKVKSPIFGVWPNTG